MVPRRSFRFPAGVLLLATALTGCGDAYASADLNAAGAVEVESTLPACAVASAPLRVDTVATGLEVPWDVAFLPDGRALVTERAGRIRVVGPDGLEADAWATLDVYDRDEVGLLGIDVAYEGMTPWVYVDHSYRSNPSSAVAQLAGKISRRIVRAIDPELGHPTTLRVVRYPITPEGHAGPPEIVVSEIPSFQLHGGGALRVGPDSMLYLANGDGAAYAVSQVPSSLRGKLLRFRLDGGIPEDNPQPESPVWVEGVRHVQGLAWDGATGAMLAIDHGPSGLPSEGGRTDRDELNVVRPGDNLGWPVVTGVTEGGPWTSAVAAWTPAIAPAGLEMYEGPEAAWTGSAFITGLRGASLRRVELDRSGGTPAPTCEEVMLPSKWGRLRLVREAPDGSLWVGTSNRDRRGTPRAEDDLILRIRPAGS